MRELREHNDYVNTTRDWMKHYNQFKATIENFKDDIASFERLLSIDAAAPIAKYGDNQGGGEPELNSTESVVARRLEIEKKMLSRKTDIENIELIVRKIDRALNVLPNDERELLIGRYFKNQSWLELSDRLYISERWARMKCNDALKNIAKIIFGKKAYQESLFVFMEC